MKTINMYMMNAKEAGHDRPKIQSTGYHVPKTKMQLAGHDMPKIKATG